jgi:hypothetical protein
MRLLPPAAPAPFYVIRFPLRAAISGSSGFGRDSR